MFNIIKSRSSFSPSSSFSSVSSFPSFLEAYTDLAVCLLQYDHVSMRQKDSGGWGDMSCVVVGGGGGGVGVEVEGEERHG